MTKQIELFDGYKIEVSDDGKIYTPEYVVLRKNGRNFLHKKKEIKPSIDKYGYYRICLSYNSKRKNYSVHRLVAIVRNLVYNKISKKYGGMKYGLYEHCRSI